MTEERTVFKIWNNFRTKKTIVVVDASDNNLYENLILKASEKLQIDGSQLVLETDGTTIDENEALVMLNKEIFILLDKNEFWVPSVTNTTNTSSIMSLDTTLSAISTDSTDIPNTVIVLDTEESSHPQEKEYNECVCFVPNALINVDEAYDEKENKVGILNQPEKIITENFWRNFHIPWHKLPRTILNEIQTGGRGKHIEEEVLSLVLREMRTIQTRIPLNYFRIIVHKIIEKSPKTFQDVDDDGVVLGDGSSTLLLKLKDRNNYKNQLVKRKHDTAINEIKKRRKTSEICIEETSQIEKKSSPIEQRSIEHKITDINRDYENLSDIELELLLEETYEKQRMLIDKILPIIQMKSMWPCFFQRRFIFWHYQRLMGHSLNQLETAMKMKIDRLLDYLHMKKYIGKTPIEASDTEKYMNLLKGLTKHFREVFDYILKTLKSQDQVNEVESLRPCLIFVEDDSKYYIVIEKIIVNDGTTDFIDALKQCYGCFYIFNMKYPERALSTMEFLQRYFMKTHPSTGTKASTSGTNKNSVIRFLKNFAEFITKDNNSN
nr:uncharacterized protein LOC111515468 isoform X2 [Leptinotarsa decemlineata]